MGKACLPLRSLSVCLHACMFVMSMHQMDSSEGRGRDTRGAFYPLLQSEGTERKGTAAAFNPAVLHRMTWQVEAGGGKSWHPTSGRPTQSRFRLCLETCMDCLFSQLFSNPRVDHQKLWRNKRCPWHASLFIWCLGEPIPKLLLRYRDTGASFFLPQRFSQQLNMQQRDHCRYGL